MTERSNGAPNVLIIDDEAGILDSLRILLKNEGFVPHVALGGKAGLDQIESLSPDIVLSDVRMPTVSGLAGAVRCPAARSRHARDSHDGAGDAAVGDAGRERRRVLLHPEAVSERRARGDSTSRGGASASARGEHVAQAGDSATRQTLRLAAHRQQPQLARRAASRRNRGAYGIDGVDPGRIRHG